MSEESCPKCGGRIVKKARNPKGPSVCENNHSMDHADTIKPVEKSSDLAKYRDVGLRVDRYGNVVFRPELATD